MAYIRVFEKSSLQKSPRGRVPVAGPWTIYRKWRHVNSCTYVRGTLRKSAAENSCFGRYCTTTVPVSYPMEFSSENKREIFHGDSMGFRGDSTEFHGNSIESQTASTEYREVSVEFSYVFANVAWKFHGVFHTESHGIPIPHGISMQYETGTAIVMLSLGAEVVIV